MNEVFHGPVTAVCSVRYARGFFLVAGGYLPSRRILTYQRALLSHWRASRWSAPRWDDVLRRVLVAPVAHPQIHPSGINLCDLFDPGGRVAQRWHSDDGLT